MKNKSNYILSLSTFPAAAIGLGQYRKELIKVGSYTHPSTKESFEITPLTLDHFVNEFGRWTANGNKVPIPAGHERDGNPELNQGWVTDMFVEDNSLYGIMSLIDSKLALTTDVSLCIEAKKIDSLKNKYHSVITHVALTTHPVIVGLEGFKKLSLSIGENNMEFLKKIAEKLGMSGDTPTEELVMSEVEKLNLKKDEIKLSRKATNADYVVKMLSENRTIKLSNLLKAGLITPAVKDVITAEYVEVEALTLSMSTKGDDGFDLLYDILVQNKPIKLEETTGVQSLELANQSAEKPNVMQKDIARRRKAAGMDS